MYYTYIVKLQNDQYYIGYTKDLKARLIKHNEGSVKTTSRIKPKELVFYPCFLTKQKAYAFEEYLKSSSGFAFRKKRLI